MSAAAAALLTDGDREAVKGVLLEFKNQYAQVKDDVAKLGKAGSDTLEKLDKLDDAMIAMRQKFDDAAKRADTMELELAKVPALPVPRKSVGEIVTADPGFLAHIRSGSRQGWGIVIPQTLYQGMVKDITGIGALLPSIQPGITSLPRLMTGVRSLVPQGTTTAGAVQYARELTFTNAANVVAEGAAKPKSDKTFEAVTQAVTTIAHYFKVSKQSYEDLPGLAAQIESNGIYGVQAKEDQQLLFGTGTPPELRGFMTVATAAPAAPPVASGGTTIDAIGLAIFDLAAKGFMADGIVINPVDYGLIAMSKGTQGQYLYANPMDYTAAARMWGIRVVQSSAMTAGQFLAGAFQGNSQILDREEVTVQVATQNEDDFVKNLLTVLIEERLVLLIYRATAFEKGVKPAPTAGEAQAAPEEERKRRG